MGYYYPDHRRSTTSLMEPTISATGIPGGKNGSGKKKAALFRDNNPSVPNLSNFISADPSRDGDSHSRKTPVSGYSKPKDRNNQGKLKK